MAEWIISFEGEMIVQAESAEEAAKMQVENAKEKFIVYDEPERKWFWWVRKFAEKIQLLEIRLVIGVYGKLPAKGRL